MNKAAYRGMNMQEGAPSMLYEEMLDDYGDSCTNLNFRGSHDGKVKNTVKTSTLYRHRAWLCQTVISIKVFFFFVILSPLALLLHVFPVVPRVHSIVLTLKYIFLVGDVCYTHQLLTAPSSLPLPSFELVVGRKFSRDLHYLINFKTARFPFSAHVCPALKQ